MDGWMDGWMDGLSSWHFLVSRTLSYSFRASDELIESYILDWWRMSHGIVFIKHSALYVS